MYDELVSLAAKLTAVMKNKYYNTALMASKTTLVILLIFSLSLPAQQKKPTTVNSGPVEVRKLAYGDSGRLPSPGDPQQEKSV